MTPALNNQKAVYRHPVLSGLIEKDLVSLYEIASVKKVNAGAAVVKEGDTDQAVYLIMKGSAQVLKKLNGHLKQISILGKGDWVPQAPISMKRGRTASVIAREPLIALVLDENGLDALPPNIQLTIYKNINRLSAGLVEDFIIRQMNVYRRNESLTSSVGVLLDARSREYTNSEMIQSVIRKIPRLPVYANRLSVLLLDENVSTRQVAEIAKSDPSLVSVVLKTVNSAYYGFRGKVSDFQHAVLILGFVHVYQLVMDVGIRSAMPKTPEFVELQFHSMVVSIVSFHLSKLCQLDDAAAMSTIGLLHDIGKSVILLIRKRHPKMALLIDMLDHAKVGSMLLKEWNIPDEVCQGLEYQSYPELLPPENVPQQYRKKVAVLHIAHMCYDYLNGKKESELPGTFLGEYMKLLNRSERSIAELVNKRLLPSLNRKRTALPESVRQLLTRRETAEMATGDNEHQKG
jgi:HD-like signal output (HDOD) protein